ncbi:unnamed protein product [Echinostoma caproni]|uniref:Uncharacterized protein n=1 Tax=Echinostoma caproni TaxID=27848 RepID=A0A183A537_9TREM|nr:unnamed protein product [Echinostoma caproni]
MTSATRFCHILVSQVPPFHDRLLGIACDIRVSASSQKGHPLILRIREPVCTNRNSFCQVNLDLGPGWIPRNTARLPSIMKDTSLIECKRDPVDASPFRSYFLDWNNGFLVGLDQLDGYVYASRLTYAPVDEVDPTLINQEHVEYKRDRERKLTKSIHSTDNSFTRTEKRPSLIACRVNQPTSNTYPDPDVLQLILSERSTLRNYPGNNTISVNLLVVPARIGSTHDMITTLRTITNELERQRSGKNVTDPIELTTDMPPEGADDADYDGSNELHAYPEVSALLVVKPVQCRAIPGHFILSCYRREIEFTWIPPQLPIKKAMIKFKEVLYLSKM